MAEREINTTIKLNTHVERNSEWSHKQKPTSYQIVLVVIRRARPDRRSNPGLPHTYVLPSRFVEESSIPTARVSLLVSENYLMLPAPDVVRKAGSSLPVLGREGEGKRKESCRLQPTLPPPLTPNKNSGYPCSNPLCCLVARPSTSTQDARTTCRSRRPVHSRFSLEHERLRC